MDLGLAFDDDDLSITKEEKRDDISLPYSVKTCTPQWFETAVESYQNVVNPTTNLDPEQIPHMFKFSGDFYYHHKNYEKAAEYYKLALEMLPENNVSVRQDVKESFCRCLLYCGQIQKSLQIARDVVTDLAGEDEAHQRQSLILLSFVCERTGRWAECVECLEKLCMNQPYFAQFWDQLGNAYMKLHSLSEGDDGNFRKREAQEEGKLHPQEHLVKALTCYIRASLLFQSVMRNAGSLIKTRNEALIDKISKKIDDLPLSEAMKAFAFQNIQREIENQEMNMEDRTESKSSSSQDIIRKDCANSSFSQLLYNNFFSWYLKFKM